MIPNNYNKLFIDVRSSIRKGLELMDKLDRKLVIATQNEKYFGLLSIGDIQRAILAKINLEKPIIEILRHQQRIATVEDSKEAIIKQMQAFRMEFMPVLNKEGILTEIIFWEDVFGEKNTLIQREFKLPVVIMAGGFGTRLRPLTNVLPKPLIPVGEHSMLEEIFQRFARYGVNDFYLSVNYKHKLIKYYIDELGLSYNISYVKESKPLGTIGSIKLLKDQLNTTFFVTNCDILINQDYSAILDYHQANNNEITIVSALKHLNLPYGTVITEKNGAVKELQEKPNLVYNINTGMYILEPHLIKEIPDDCFYHITNLIEKVLTRNGKVGAFPISENAWIDTGEWSVYLKNFVK